MTEGCDNLDETELHVVDRLRYGFRRRHASPDSLLGTRAAELRRAKGTLCARRDGTDVSVRPIDERGSSTDRVSAHEVTHMTKQESFKRRVRERMEQTGERYGAARRALLGGLADATPASNPEADGTRVRARAAEPDLDDLTIKRATGRDWDEWCDLIDAWPGHDEGHRAIAAHLHGHYDIGMWWGQAVTVGYERITGRRVANQLSDGTFSAGKTRTVTVDVAELRAAIVDDADRAALFPGLDTHLRSKPTSKSLRVGVAIDGQSIGSALFSFVPKADGRVMVNVSHDELPDAAAVVHWKQYWSDWLAAIDEA